MKHLSLSLLVSCYINFNRNYRLECWGEHNNDLSTRMISLIPNEFNTLTFNTTVGPHHMCAIRGYESLMRFGAGKDKENQSYMS